MGKCILPAKTEAAEKASKLPKVTETRVKGHYVVKSEQETIAPPRRSNKGSKQHD